MSTEAFPLQPAVTATRYRLTNGVLHDDLLVGANQRWVTYPIGNPEQEKLRQSLELGGFILGTAIKAPDNEKRFYSVPIGARPLHLESNVVSGGPFGYSDQHLMYDLGELSGRVRAQHDVIIAGPQAETAFAIVDFIKQGDPHLYLSPGAEQLLVPVTEDPLEAQINQFSPEFLEQYRDSINSFADGFRLGVNS